MPTDFSHETVPYKSYDYNRTTPPEKVRADYTEAHNVLQNVHEQSVDTAQGKKFYKDYGDGMKHFSSGDKVGLIARSYPQAAKNLHNQDQASKRYASENLDVLLEQAREIEGSQE